MLQINWKSGRANVQNINLEIQLAEVQLQIKTESDARCLFSFINE